MKLLRPQISLHVYAVVPSCFSRLLLPLLFDVRRPPVQPKCARALVLVVALQSAAAFETRSSRSGILAASVMCHRAPRCHGSSAHAATAGTAQHVPLRQFGQNPHYRAPQNVCSQYPDDKFHHLHSASPHDGVAAASTASHHVHSHATPPLTTGDDETLSAASHAQTSHSLTPSLHPSLTTTSSTSSVQLNTTFTQLSLGRPMSLPGWACLLAFASGRRLLLLAGF